MIFRSYDLAIYASNVNHLLNDPCLRLISMDITCSSETGYTLATLRFEKCPKQDRKYYRYLARFLVEREESLLDDLLTDKNNRVIKQHIFPVEEGNIVVVDYQTKKRKV